jgi:hypothetical protein
MTQNQKGNVVAMGDHLKAKGRISRQQSAQMISDCRSLAVERMSRSLAAMLDHIEDDLFDLAEKAADRESQNTYLDARSQARDKRTLIQDTFRHHFSELFDSKVSGREVPASLRDEDTPLSLVGEDDLAASLALEEMARKVRVSCEGELIALSQRLGFLMERPELADDANPLSPTMVCAALKDACDKLEASFKVRMTILQQLERYVAADLQGLYHELNAHLVARSVLPDVRPAYRRAPAQPHARPAGVQRPEPRAPAAPQPAPSASSRDLFAALASVLATPVPNGAPSVPPAFVTELTRLHREAAAVPPGAEHALVNVVRRIRSASSTANLAANDSITIDLVAMLFDFIFDDEHIPAAAKAHLGRLQIPTLKVALLDKSFFSSNSHPARRLLDLLAESAMGMDHATPREAEVVRLIERVVQRVLDEYGTDPQVFARLAAEMGAFIEERHRSEASLVERSARVIEEREREEDARLASHDAMARRLAAREWVPPIVRAMLQDMWTQGLVRVHRSEGEDSAMWQGLLATADDLLWSVEPKHAPDDRKRLVTMLPGMLKRIQLGMERAEMPDADRTAFLGALVDCHATAMKAGMRGLAVVPSAPTPAPKLAEPELERATVPVGDVSVEEIRLRTPRDMAVRNVFTRTGIWTHLQRGTWVEFTSEGARTRARLTWISPNKGVYLFTNPFSASSAVSVSPEALAEQMRRGEARVIDDSPLTERAVGSMLASLKGAQG